MEISEKLSHNEFLKSIGLKGTALMAVYWAGEVLTACDGQEVTPSDWRYVITRFLLINS
jgi:hypothetical protein